MGSINLVTQFSPKEMTRFRHTSFTDRYAGHGYKFTGEKAIKILTTDTLPLTDYQRTGTERFGTLTEITDTVQEMIVTKDRSTTGSIDKGNNKQQLMIKSANKWMKMENDEVIVPELDTYRLSKWAAGAGTETAEAEAPNKDNILPMLFQGGMIMSNALVPRGKRVCFIKESIYLLCNLAPLLHGNEYSGGKALREGQVPKINGMHMVPVPDAYMPADVNFIIKAAGTTVDPIQLKTYRILTNQRGVDGHVVEMRIIYDSFVFTQKNKGIYVSTYSAP